MRHIPGHSTQHRQLRIITAAVRQRSALTPGVLKGELHDAHIYQNHLPQVAQQLQRTPYKLPSVEIPDENWHSMLNWHAKDGCKLKDYICHEKLRGDVAR